MSSVEGWCITVRYLYRGWKLRHTFLLEFSWVTSKAAARGQPCCFYCNGEVNVRDWKFPKRWCSGSRSRGLTLRSAAVYFSTFRRNLPPSYSSSRVHLSLKVNPVPFFETSALNPAVEHRGIQRTNYHGKWVLQRSRLLYGMYIIHSFCGLLRQVHTLLQSQFSTECHQVFPL